MNEALCSILCDQEPWTFNPYVWQTIKFNKDGTGELLWIGDMVYVLAANFEWKSLPKPESDRLNKTAGTKTTLKREPQLLGTLNIEITLQKTVTKTYAKFGETANEKYFTDAAFRTRHFTVTIEKGNFLPDAWVGLKGFDKSRWGLRLLFDQSPYPTGEGVNSHALGRIDITVADLDEMKTFLARSLPESEARGKATNDDSFMGYRGNCAMS